jgi:hypothetical protein
MTLHEGSNTCLTSTQQSNTSVDVMVTAMPKFLPSNRCGRRERDLYDFRVVSDEGKSAVKLK